ncbi:unnamed protein product [Chironomus riparius]|uniref:Uncharacterized protein n=1 Tax=Chironomus riparius TaxID=315576 RepID=A0A9N9RXM8_9DIPT|nr:unnamed protein product [Chironomus riparius]
MQIAVLFVVMNVLLLSHSLAQGASQGRYKRSPDKYDDHYSKFLAKHFSDVGAKHIDGQDEYKNASNDNDSYEEEGGDEEEESDDPKSDAEDHGSYSYSNNEDYQRIKALSEAQVAKLEEKPGNCKHFEKDGMICSECKDPETGDTSESCNYASEPEDKKMAYTSKKSHNYKSPEEVEEPADHEEESEDQEEAPVTPSSKVPRPAKQYKSEMEDAGDYGAYKLAGYNSDVDDYDEHEKFAHLKVEPKNEAGKKDFEILPNSQFKTKNLNEALTDFNTKDWSKCSKVKKGEMTCYYCKDAKGATQEECMFISSSNPKNLKVERKESSHYNHNSRKPNATPDAVEIIKSLPLKVGPIVPDNRERFARLRMGRPLVPTKANLARAEPLVTPKINTNINPVDYIHFDPTFKKTIKRKASYRQRKNFDFDFLEPSESRASKFESHVRHQ